MSVRAGVRIHNLFTRRPQRPLAQGERILIL